MKTLKFPPANSFLLYDTSSKKWEYLNLTWESSWHSSWKTSRHPSWKTARHSTRETAGKTS